MNTSPTLTRPSRHLAGRLLGWLLPLAFVVTALADQPAPLPLDPAVRVGTLPNGLTYFIRKNAKPEKRVELRLAVNAGSLVEADDQRGMAHFAEHMAFRGSPRFPGMEIIHYLQSVGANVGPEISAFTGFDETVYQLTLPTDPPEILAKGLQIMTDWAHAASYAPADIAKERPVIVEEWRLGRGADQRMSDKFYPVLFQNSKYAQRLPIGTRESIEGTTDAAIKRFYTDWYRPDNMAFIVVGDIDPDRLEAAIRAEFGPIPAPTKPTEVAPVGVPDHQEPLYTIVSDKEARLNLALVIWKAPPASDRNTAEHRQRLAETLFLEMFNQRLAELAQQGTPPFIGARAQHQRLVRSSDGFQLLVAYADGGITRGLGTLLTEAERVRRHGFTAAELERAKKSLLKQKEQAFNEHDKTPSAVWANGLMQHFLNGAALPGSEFEFAFAQTELPQIALEAVNPIAARWMTTQNQVTVVQAVEKEGAKLPTEEEVRAIAQQVAASSIDPYRETASAASLMPEKPKPGRVTATKPIAAIGVTELTLANGVRVVLKPTTFQNDQIAFSAFRPGGQSAFADDYNLSVQLTGFYTSLSGAGPFPVTELQKFLAGKKLGLMPSLSLYYDEARGGCSVADLETLLQLIYLDFAQPRIDPQAFNSLVMRIRSQLQNMLANPEAFGANEAKRILYGNHPRTPDVLPTEADWQTVSLEKIATVLKSRFGNAAGFTFVFTGSFTVEAITPLLETYLGSLPVQPGPQTWHDLGLRFAEAPLTRDLHKGTDPKCTVRLALGGPADSTRDEGHRLWSLGNILKRVYFDTLREEMGGVYDVRVDARIPAAPGGRFSFEITLPCAPEKADRLAAAVTAEIERIRKNGPTEAEVQKEVEAQRRTAQKDATDNAAWLSALDKIYRDGETTGRLANPEELIALLNPAELQKIAVKYLDPAKFARVNLLPEAPPPAAPAAPAPAAK